MMARKANVAIISPGDPNKLETFVKAHVDHLDANTYLFHGGIEDFRLAGENPRNMWRKGLLRVFGSLVGYKHFDCYWTMRSEFKRLKIDFVLFEYGTTAAIFLPVMERINVPFIVTFFGYEANIKTVVEKYKSLYKKVFAKAQVISVVSKEMIDKLVDLGCPREKAVYNPCGPNVSFFEIKPKFESQNLFALGRFVDKKSPIELILVVEKLRKIFPEIKLIFGGDGPLFEAARRLVNGLDLQNHVKLVGRLNREEYIEYLEGSIAFVQHSVTADNGDQEGTPVSILEAGLAGLPVVSTKHAGIPEIVVDGQTGLLVEEHDLDKMVEAISKLLNNKQECQRLGENAKKHVNANFSMAAHLDLMNSYFTL